MTTNNLIYTGSVKDIYQSENEKHVTFSFSDRYSIFDWGQMPDLIEDKGKALSLIGAFFFEMLGEPKSWLSWEKPCNLNNNQIEILNIFCQSGINHHFVKLSEEIDFGLEVLKVDVPSVGHNSSYDYSFYQNEVLNTLVPLEVIFRFGVPVGSSLVNRRKDVKFGDVFESPFIEFSSKLESVDRYMTNDEAQTIAGLKDSEMEELLDTTSLIALRLKDFFSEHNIELWDGKFEFAFGADRKLQLVDSIGPDELRLVYEGESLSKEYLRQYYSDSSWKKSLNVARKENIEDVNNYVENVLGDGPLKLDQDYKKCFSDLYKSLTNLLYGPEDKKFNTLSFSNVIKNIKNNKEKRSL